MADKYADRIYEIEDRVIQHTQGAFRIHAIDEAQAFIDHVITTPWWRSRSSVRKIHVISGKDTSRRAYVIKGRWNTYYGRTYSGTIMVIPMKWANNKVVLAHELAHLMTNQDYPKHNTKFMNDYIAVIEKFVSERCGSMLKEEFMSNRILQ